MACAIISTARLHSKVSPIWPTELAQLSGLQHHHFLNVEQKIIDAFEAAIPNDSRTSQASSKGQNPLQSSSRLSHQNQSERSDVFQKEEMERMLEKSKGLSTKQKSREGSVGPDRKSSVGKYPTSESP